MLSGGFTLKASWLHLQFVFVVFLVVVGLCWCLVVCFVFGFGFFFCDSNHILVLSIN